MFDRSLTQTRTHKRRFRLLGITTLVILSAIALTTISSFTIGTRTAGAKMATITVCAVGCDHTTIQAAVNAASAGDTVNVAAETFTENVTLNKMLTLNGAQTGVNACGRSATETIIAPAAGTALTLQTGSAGAIIDGFTFSGGARGIESSSGPLDNLQIRNNRFTGFTGAGVFLNDTGVDITVHQNEIDGASKTSAGGSFHLDTDGFDGFRFTNNCVKNAPLGPGLFSDGNRNVGLSASRAPLFDGNVFESHTTNVGVNIGSRSIEDATFSNNIFRNNAFDGLQGGPLRTTFSGNSFVNNGRHGLALTSFGNLTAGRGASFVTIKGNLISGNGFTNAGAGILYSNQPAGTQVTNHANLNRIVGNATGVTNSSAETIDVVNNWWGCNFGPGAGGAGCSGTPNGLGGTGVATITSSPWLVLGINAMPGTILVGGMSNLTADLTINSAISDTSGSGSIPNGTPATFAGVFGTVAPMNTTTTSGKANSVFTGVTAGMGSASTTVDMQTVSTPISINQAPTITCPQNIVQNTDPDQCSAVVTFTPTVTGNPAPTVVCTPASGFAFPKGVTTVTCTASNGILPDATCGFTVTVNDAQNPTPACPANITTNTDAGQCSAAVTYTTPTASDNCSGTTVVCLPASGSTFQKGVTTVTCTTTDASNNTASCSFSVTVVDNENPTITCPANQSVIGTGPTVVTYPAPTANDNCPGVTATCTPASGSTFQVGVTTVTCTATDAVKLTASCSFTVTVTTCTLTCPSDLTVGTIGTSATVNYTPPTAVGSCGTVNCSPVSGATFQLGTTTVTCNSSLGSRTCAFRVTVERVNFSVADPLACAGPGSSVTGTFTITNNGNAPVSVNATVALPVGLVGLPGSGIANVGVVNVTGAAVNFQASLAQGQTATVSYQAQIGDQVPPGTTLCSNLSVTFDGGPALTVQACTTVNCQGIGPGAIPSAASESSDQKNGSVLIYNIYTSGATSGNTQNTRINITNAHPTLSSFVHLFFVAEGCSVADSYICLTGNQTASFLASDLDPGTTGYLVAVAVNAIGCPTSFNYLIGDEYVKFSTGHAANLGAIAFAQIAGGLPLCDGNTVTATLNFDGISYNRTPATLALDNIGSRADGNDTLLIINRIGGNLGIGASTLSTVFGILYDDAENALSFSVTGSCQLRNSLSNNFPRTTPRFETFIPAGRTGWLKVFNQTGAIGITGAAINFNSNASASAGAFNQGHNLHHLTLNNQMSYIIPIFPPSC